MALVTRTTAFVLVAAAAGTVCGGAFAQGVEVGEIRRDFSQCHAVSDAGQRLACYDARVVKLEPPRFKGSLSDDTPAFTVAGPTLLRYQSDGAIFVMYLKDENGKVLQNLHIGGGGESSYLIEKPGTYSLQVSGSETWRIWVVPETPRAPPHG